MSIEQDPSYAGFYKKALECPSSSMSSAEASQRLILISTETTHTCCFETFCGETFVLQHFFTMRRSFPVFLQGGSRAAATAIRGTPGSPTGLAVAAPWRSLSVCPSPCWMQFLPAVTSKPRSCDGKGYHTVGGRGLSWKGQTEELRTLRVPQTC